MQRRCEDVTLRGAGVLLPDFIDAKHLTWPRTSKFQNYCISFLFSALIDDPIPLPVALSPGDNWGILDCFWRPRLYVVG